MPEDVASPEWDAWFEMCKKLTLYENPLGADYTVHEFWHLPAVKFGQPLLKQIYNNGLEVLPSQLPSFEKEISSLEKYWGSYNFPDNSFLTGITIHENGSESHPKVHISQHLLERLGYLKEAINCAKEFHGVISIT